MGLRTARVKVSDGFGKVCHLPHSRYGQQTVFKTFKVVATFQGYVRPVLPGTMSKPSVLSGVINEEGSGTLRNVVSASETTFSTHVGMVAEISDLKTALNWVCTRAARDLTISYPTTELVAEFLFENLITEARSAGDGFELEWMDVTGYIAFGEEYSVTIGRADFT